MPSPRRLLLLALLLLAALPARPDDLDLLRARLETGWLAHLDLAAAREQLAALRPDGSWPDLDYTDKQGTNWPHLQHVERSSLLARAYRAHGSPLARSPELRDAIARAWEFWFTHDFTNINWWYNEIGVPRALAPGLVLLRGELSVREREQGLRILARAKLQGESQNLVWLAENVALRGLVADDPELVGRAYARIAAEIRLAAPGAEGVQLDRSFLQHRRCLYNHGYGASFAVDGTRLAAFLSGTRFALEAGRVALLESFLLDGSQWMSLGPWQDWGARGREIARIGRGASPYLATAAEHLLSLEPPPARAGELRALSARTREQPGADALSGARHFWRGDFTVLQRPGFYASVRTFSSRLANTDFNGPENILAHHIADGATALMTRGGEYAAIFPLWDWQRLPGVTARLAPPLIPAKVRRENGTRDFVGGVTDGRDAFAVFDFERDGLVAKKAWLLSDAGLVALGAGITDPEKQPVATTLNQALRRGPLAAAADARWLHHDGLAYLALDSAELRYESGTRAGSWRRIHKNLPDAPVSGELFTVWLDHGSGPRDARYAYLVAPASDPTSAATLAMRPPAKVLLNTSSIQAVSVPGAALLGVAFHEPGELDLGDLGALGTDQPCLMLLRVLPEGRVALGVADPTQKIDRLQLRLGRARATAILPTGAEAGSTLTLQLAPR